LPAVEKCRMRVRAVGDQSDAKKRAAVNGSPRNGRPRGRYPSRRYRVSINGFVRARWKACAQNRVRLRDRAVSSAAMEFGVIAE